jgi:acetolactate synthase-1/2/3 large subunit
MISKTDVPSRPSTSGKITVEFLNANGINCVFGIPATHVVEIYEGIRQDGNIRSVVGRNEQATSYMADGYARRARSIGATLVTGGPGLGNSVTGLQCAYSDSTPVLLLTSDLNPDVRSRQPIGIPHETFDSEGVARATGAHTQRIDSPHSITQTLESVVESMLAGRFRPGVCLYSRAVLENNIERSALSIPKARAVSRSKPEISGQGEAISAVAQALVKSKRPLILAGMGVYWASGENELASLVFELGIPCLTTVPATGVVPRLDADLMGTVSLAADRALLTEADLIIAVGASFGSVTSSNGTLKIDGKIIQVNIDPHDIGQIYPAEIGILMDAKDFLAALIEELGSQAKLNDIWRPCFARPIENPWVKAIEVATEGISTTIAADVCITSDWMYKSLPITNLRRLFMPWNYMNLGWSYAAAIGMKAAAPEDFVISVMGDGGALFSLGEAATAVESDLPVCLLVFNNKSYGTIALVQQNWFAGNKFGVDLSTPNFRLYAEAFGLPYKNCKTPEELTAALKEFSTSRKPTVIEVEIELNEQAFLTELYSKTN